MKTAYSLFVILFLLFSGAEANAQAIDTTLVEFVQGDKVFKVTSEAAAISLEKKPFSIRFYNRRYDDVTETYYAANIAVLNKPDNGIEVGMSREEIPYLAGGTGIAMDADEGTIFLSEDGHHYLYYASEEDRRVKLLSKHGEWLKLDWQVRSLFTNDTDSSIEELKYDKLYFILLFDRNLNEMIDERELKKVVVTFK